VEGKNYLGIYISQTSATAVLLSPKTGGYQLDHCFSTSVQTDEQQDVPSLAALIKEACAQRSVNPSDVAVALDCVMFTQHSMHSEFKDHRQIAQTIKYDAEEAISVDASDLAVSFEIIGSNESGSQLTVYAARKKLLSELLTDLQNNNLDPVVIEPDVTSLSRFTHHHFEEFRNSAAIFAVFSERCCYLMIPSKTQHAAKSRAFLISPTQDKNQLLTREILLTLAAAGPGESISKLRIAQNGDGVDCEQLSRNTGLETEIVHLTEAANADPGQLTDCKDLAGFAIAYGAAMGLLSKTPKVDFRADFSPYLGKKLLIEKSLKILSVTVTVLLLTVGLYMQLRLFKTNQYISRLREKLLHQYSAVMMGEKLPKKEQPTSKIKRELVRIQKIKAGQLTAEGEESVSALLSYILETFNNTPKTVNLNIDSISISTKNITISGDTNRRQDTIKLIKTIDEHPNLKTSRFNYEQKNNRDEFHLTVIPTSEK
jgi:hypothetical protein